MKADALISFTHGARSSVLLLAITSMLAFSGCRLNLFNGYSFDYKGQTATRSEMGDIDSSVTAIEIKNKFGDVHVETTAAQGNWSWEGKCWATDADDADFFLSELQMQVEQDGSTQTWTVILPEQDKLLRGVKSNLTIQIPSQVAVTIRNEHGNVVSHGVSGTVNIDNEHGDVEAVALAGKSKIKNEHGDVKANEITGTTTLDTEHGEVVVDGIAGVLTVHAEHGSVSVKNSTNDVTTRTEHANVSIGTSGYLVKCIAEHGDVEIHMNSSEFDTITANTEHSDVDIYLPASASPNLRISVDHGKTKSDFQSNPSKSASRIRVDTEHGDVHIREK